MIEWTKEFETGSAKLDQQHRLLIDNINLLKDLVDTPDFSRLEAAFAVVLVNYLEAYADIHFKGEEQCMEAYRCPVHEINQRQHHRFRGFIHNYKRLCEKEGFKVQLLRNLHEAMREWIVEHILKIDTQLKPCIQKQQAI